ncbi:BTB domain-containing protein [Caenorhabditis elegans]|uniref:BTB domain-containing protein n=1 Tax=Caenorhabditis elegans TaxID=6239 RepID=Q17524_CAEEL|nr:BTB domain-containing protein [Caenorhabditis elegans]CCD62048.2 BTB domain-containing protein [Caenorhabditis elegans]|eukprot:NP_501189.2 Uncharacterized protein CELE_B0496.2 [Caenorhabditis elegans]
MNNISMKTQTVTKLFKLPEDSEIGKKVQISICDILGLHWTGFWTISCTAEGRFEINCEEKNRSRWKFLAQVELQFTGEGQTPVININKEIEFTPKLKIMVFDPIDQGCRYNKVNLKITRKSSVGVAVDKFIDFEKKNSWLDALIRSEDGKKMMYANSGILALNSPILKQKLQNDKKAHIIIPSESFAAMEKLMNFLHPPYKMEREIVEEVLDLASKWKMESVLTKYEQLLIRERCKCQDSSLKNVKLADKFKMRSLLEDILYNDTCNVYDLLDGNDYSSWTRAAMFEFVLEMENDYADDDESENTLYGVLSMAELLYQNKIYKINKLFIFQDYFKFQNTSNYASSAQKKSTGSA